MKSRTIAKIGATVLIVMMISSPFQLRALYSQAQATFPTITSYRVNGSANYTSPGSEPFWNGIPWTNASLSASRSPGGGHTPYLLMKSANDGFNIYLLFRWVDSSGPSFASDTESYQAANGSLVPLTPNATAFVNQLYYNSTYYYPDRVAALWFVGNQTQRQQAPVMMLGSNGAITGGSANIWHWQSNPTDNNANDTGFPGGYTDPGGNTIYPADNLSFAEDDYTNTTGFFVIGGSFGVNASNLDPYADPFLVHVGSLYSFANKTWTVEMVRALTVHEASNYRVQLFPGSSYYFAMAVWQGRLGESSEFKSVSQWYNLTISAQSPSVQTTSTTSTTGGVSTTLAAAAAAAALVIGALIGTVVRAPRKQEGK